MKLTNYELAVLKAIDSSEYGDSLSDAIWMFSVWDNIDHSVVKNRSSLSGIISSLVKKGYVRTDAFEGTGLNDDATIEMTMEGVDAYIAAIPAEPYKA